MKHLADKRGVALIGAVAALLILSLVGAVVVSLVGKQTYSAIHQAQSDQAFALAEAGAYRALSFLGREDGECVELSDALQFSNVSLGQGTFTVTGTRYNPTPTFLTSGIGPGNTTIPVGSTANYAPHGIITIGTENIHYSGTTPTSFTGARRGASGTTAATHSTTSANAVLDWTLSESVDWTIGALALKAAGAPSIQFDAEGYSVQDVTSTSFPWSHTVSGANKVLVVGVSIRNLPNQVVNVTYNGTGLTPVGAYDDESSVRVEIWRLVAPPTGTYNVEVTLLNPTKIVGGSVSLTGVDQGPIAASDFDFATGSSTNPSLTLAAVDTTAWVIDFLAFRSTGKDAPSATVGNGRIQRVSGYTENGANDVNVRGKASTGQAGGVLQDQCLVTSTGAIGPGANQSRGITYDKLTTFQQESCDPCEWPHPVSPDGTDRILVVSLGYGDDPNPIMGVTYNSIALTEIRTEIIPSGRITSMWYLVNPPTGDWTVSVDLSAPSTEKFSGSSASYAGVDQTNPVEGANVGAQGISGTSSVDITTTNEGAWIIDSHNAGSNWNMADNTGRVERSNRKIGTYTQAESTMKTTTPGTYTLDWTESTSTTTPWVIVGAALNPAPIDQPTITLGRAQRVVEVAVRSP